MTALRSVTRRRIRTLLPCVALAILMLVAGSAFGLRISGPGDSALAGALLQNFDSAAAEVAPIQYFTVRSAGDDRALVDDFSYVPVPEPHVAMLLGLGLLTLAGTRIRDLQPRPRPTFPAESEAASETLRSEGP
jgi:hypothetical protein